MRLGILDQVPLHEGDTIEQTMEATKRLVVEAERLGYDRYWFAEHHNTNGLLSAAPELFLARMGDITFQIRLGPEVFCYPSIIRSKSPRRFQRLPRFIRAGSNWASVIHRVAVNGPGGH